MPDLGFLFKVSRPRFWIYIFGPYIVGLVAGVGNRFELINFLYLIFGFYFLYPANLLIYGVNDIFDYETDKLNEKKIDYETLVTPERRYGLWLAIFLTNFAFAGILWLGTWPAIASAAAFLFFSVFYSTPPVRAKAIPFLDSAFNILYVMPGVFSYSLVTGKFPPVLLIVAGGLWTAAMHAFSAIPDIDADREAKLSTIATVLGPVGTHIFCLAAYIASGILSWQYLSYFSIIVPAIYTVLMITSMLAGGREGVFRVYRVFPLVNAMVGFALFWYLAIPKFF